MNRKPLILLLLALVVIGSAGMILVNRHKESWSEPEARMGDKVLPHFEPNAVESITIQGKSALHLVHSNEVWRVQERSGYPANFHQISDTLIKLKNLKVVEAETVDASDLGRVNLAEPGTGSDSGILVQFFDAQGNARDSILLGKKHVHESAASPFGSGAADGRYVLVPGDPKNVYLVPDALAGLQPNPQSWLNKDFFKPEKVESISFTSTNAAQSWKVERASPESTWSLDNPQPGETLDATKMAQCASLLNLPAFLDVADGSNLAGTGLDNPLLLNIETFEHFHYALKIGAKSPAGNYYMTVAVTAEIPAQAAQEKLKLAREQALAPWVYTASSWLLNPLIRERSSIMQGSSGSATTESAAPVEAAPPKPDLAPLMIKKE